MQEETERNKKAWKKFQDKMNDLRKKKFEILTNIHKKLDQQKIEALNKKLQNK